MINGSFIHVLNNHWILDQLISLIQRGNKQPKVTFVINVYFLHPLIILNPTICICDNSMFLPTICEIAAQVGLMTPSPVVSITPTYLEGYPR